MTRPGRHVLVAGALALGLLAGCSDGAASSEQTGSPGTETSSTDDASNAAAPASGNGLAETQNDQVPSVWVLDAPSGFQTQGPAGPGEAGKWKELLTGEGGCTLSARGNVAEKPVEDMRSASVELLQSVAEADDAQAEDARDLTLVSSGAGEGNDPKSTLTFVSADWAAGDAMVRGASRVMDLMNPDGSMSSESLTIRFSCPGDAIDEDAWAAVTQDIRPVLHSGSPEDEPWASRFTSPEAD